MPGVESRGSRVAERFDKDDAKGERRSVRARQFRHGSSKRVHLKDQLESLVSLMVERGILLEEAVTEFEKKFIKRVLERSKGNQCRAAKVLGMHRNTLSRKIGEYKLNNVGRRNT